MNNDMTSETKHVSRGRLDEIGMGDPVFTAELIDIMIEDGLSRVRHIRAAFEAQRMEELGKIAHSLKGAALNVGAAELANLCASIDDTVRKLGQTIEGAKILAVEQEFDDVARELGAIKLELTA